MKGEAQQTFASSDTSGTPSVPSTLASDSRLRDSKGLGSMETQESKSGVRQFFGLGKKKDIEEARGNNDGLPTQTLSHSAGTTTTTMGAPSLEKRPANLEPTTQNAYGSTVAGSPSRLRSSSPGFHSPASSEIFERNVQEPAQILQLHGEMSPAHIPSHVITEDHIPPALEASAQAITSGDLDPDEVEIVTSASHLPAASGLESSASHADLTQLHPLQHARSDSSSQHRSGSAQAGAEEDTASNYGQLDPTDVRRLSFISFADVVQSEHQAPTTHSSLSEPGHRDSLYLANLANAKQDRAASPLRSPRSPSSIGSHRGGLATPPPGVVVNQPYAEQSPGRSTMLGPGTVHGELQIETMRQAVRKTASGDLGVRNTGMSPISDEGLSSRSRSRENS